MATIGEWAKMYGTGNYADTSKRIGDSVEEAINQNRVRTDRRRLAEDRERKQALEDYSMEQLKIQEYSAFNFPIDSQYDNMENQMQTAGGLLADTYYKVDNDDSMTTQERAMAKANILKQVGTLKGAKAQYVQKMTAGAQAIATTGVGGASSYNSEEDLSFYATGLTPDNGNYFEMEDGTLVLKGKTVTGDEISMPVNKFDQMSTLAVTPTNPNDSIKVANKLAYDNNVFEVNDDVRASWENTYDQYKTNVGEDGLKHAAADWMFMERKEIDAMAANTGGQFGYVPPDAKIDTKTGQPLSEERYESELDYVMGKRFQEMGEANFIKDSKGILDNRYRAEATRALQAKTTAAANAGDPNEVFRLQEQERLANSFTNTTENLNGLGFSQNDAGVFSGDLQIGTDIISDGTEGKINPLTKEKYKAGEKMGEDKSKLNPRLKEALGKMGLEVEEFGDQPVFNEVTGEIKTPGTVDYIKISRPGGSTSGKSTKKSITLSPGDNAQKGLQNIFIAQGFSEAKAKELASGFINGNSTDNMSFNEARAAQIANPGSFTPSGLQIIN